jgi:hypothetical protein
LLRLRVEVVVREFVQDSIVDWEREAEGKEEDTVIDWLLFVADEVSEGVNVQFVLFPSLMHRAARADMTNSCTV